MLGERVSIVAVGSQRVSKDFAVTAHVAHVEPSGRDGPSPQGGAQTRCARTDDPEPFSWGRWIVVSPCSYPSCDLFSQVAFPGAPGYCSRCPTPAAHARPAWAVDTELSLADACSSRLAVLEPDAAARPRTPACRTCRPVGQPAGCELGDHPREHGDQVCRRSAVSMHGAWGQGLDPAVLCCVNRAGRFAL